MIIDEAQRFPKIFSYLQVLVDEQNFAGAKRSKYIVTGSANFALMQQISQSMAGCTAVLTLWMWHIMLSIPRCWLDSSSNMEERISRKSKKMR